MEKRQRLSKEVGSFLFFVFTLSIGLIAGLVIGISSCNGETEIQASMGYHTWSESGHTFPSSDVHDKAWNGWAVEAEGTYWWDQVGLYVYGGFDFPVDEEMFSGWRFKANARYAGIGGKARMEITKNVTAYMGGGVNYTHLENEYGNGTKDIFDDFGPDVVAGINYYITPDYFITLNGRYTFNEMNSKVFG